MYERSEIKNLDITQTNEFANLATVYHLTLVKFVEFKVKQGETLASAPTTDNLK